MSQWTGKSYGGYCGNLCILNLLKLGLAPALCLVAEDADAGIAAAKAAGMRVIAVGPAASNPDADFALPQGFAPLL